MYKRQLNQQITKRLLEKRRFIQVLYGPRQVGKTTLIDQSLKEIALPSHYASADEPGLRDIHWLEQQWEAGRSLLKTAQEGILVLDEVHKIEAWSSIVKKLWDEDSRKDLQLKVVLLGSSPLLILKGLTESLAGRFEIVPVPHWSFREMNEAFGFDVDKFVFFGGYPGAAVLADDEQRWARYINDALIETTLSRDVLLTTRVNKPALLRRLFHLGCEYSGQILSYQKMTGQLQEAGNTTTLAHYLELFGGIGMLTGLNKFHIKGHLQKASSPKFQVFNNALMTAISNKSFQQARGEPEYWGRLVESAVGAYLLNELRCVGGELYYWREGGHEVDFVVQHKGRVIAIEVKSGRRRDALPGMDAFVKTFNPDKKLLVGGQGIALETFLASPIEQWCI